ncbi:MAG TPA: PH domain-containing protein, partial [Phycisphaerales bacterium]|nr:PH domain-containing protein [Phycisphaerales bacterium]
EHGIAVRYPLRTRVLRWSEIKQFRHDQEGGYVSPRLRGGIFDTAGITSSSVATAALQSTRDLHDHDRSL